MLHNENEFNRKVKIIGSKLAFPEDVGKTGNIVGMEYNRIKLMYLIKFDDATPISFAYEEDLEFLNS